MRTARWPAVLAIPFLMLASSFAVVSKAAEEAPVPVPAPPPVKSRKLIPLPIYATLPNEGDTYGFMPVLLVVEKETQRTESIVAPSLSWNKIIRYTHTFRWYYYPDDEKTLTLIPSFSTNVNRGVTFEYADLPKTVGRRTLEAGLRARRSLFYRFFGIGPETRPGDETSYTRVGGELTGRLGYTLTPRLNIGATLELARELVERRNVSFLPLTNDRFPGTPGLGGATTIMEGMSLRYDTRQAREYSLSGIASELSGGVAQGLAGSPAFARLTAEIKGLWPESSFVQGGARLFWQRNYGSGDIPFPALSSLGGSSRLRGFTQDRFIDRAAWEIELEQRVTLFQTHIYGVTTDWRIDPFIAVGQVYSDASRMFREVRVAGGLGFRAFVRPNVLGRIDTAVGGEGIKVYVELGYPF